MEVWQKVVGFEGCYMVSNHGNVKNSRNGYLKKQNAHHKNGYMTVSLWDKGKEKRVLVHRIVMKAFSKEEEKETVNHIDGNKRNNTLGNLEWATYLENMNHARKNGLMNYAKGENKVCKINESIALTIKSLGPEFGTYKQIGDYFGISNEVTRKIYLNESWKCVLE